MADVFFQPTIVIAGEDPDWVFALQRLLRDGIGWEHDIVLTFAAHKALEYVQHRPTRLLIVTPKLMASRGVDLIDLIGAAREHHTPPHILLAVESLPMDDAVDLVPAPLATPDAVCTTALDVLRAYQAP